MFKNKKALGINSTDFMNKIILGIYFFCFGLSVSAQTADFTYSTGNGLFCNPSTVQFTQTSTGNPIGFVWTFGNGMGSNSPNPSIVYNKAGTYAVKLIVIYQRMTVVVSKAITINSAVTVSIGYDRNYICKAGIINFTGISGSLINSYSWDFGDGTAIVSTNMQNISHDFATTGKYQVSLLATALSGCFDSNKTVITFQNPPITGTVSPISGCIPANVKFNASATIPNNSSITNYSWNFGDGSPTLSTITNNTSHTYSSAGKFSPSVTVTTSEGCTNSYSFGAVAFGTPPFNQTSYPVSPTICGSDTAKFISKAMNANSY